MDIKIKDNNKLKLNTFIQFEYIESTGTQYIDTGISFPIGFRTVAKLYPTNISSYKTFAGAYQKNLHNIHRIQDGKWNPCTQDNSINLYGTVNVNTLYTVDMSNANAKYNLIVNGTTLANNVSTPTGYSSLTCWLFALHRTDNTDYHYYYGRIYEISLYDENNVLKFHGIPALDSNNIVCMYDTVSQTSFYNQGTGNFIAGPVVKSGITETILLKTTTLYHKNTPNVDGRQLLNSILNYQKTHQDEVKEYYYPTTQLWQNIITEYPDIVQYYNMNHKLCIFICDADDPEQYTEDFLQAIEDYPDIADGIINNPEVVHSLFDTGYETFLTSSGTQCINTELPFIQGFRITSRISFTNISQNQQFSGTFDGSSRNMIMLRDSKWNVCIGENYNNKYGTVVTNTVYDIDISNANNKGIVIINGTQIGNDNISGNYAQGTVSLFAVHNTNNESYNFASIKLGTAKLYDNNDTLVRWLVPIQNNGNPCMIDLLTGTKYLNQGTGSFTYSLEPKNA